MPLTIRQIDAAQPGPKPVRLYDGGGLYLEISPTGAKLWRWKYRLQGREKRLALGRYPEVSLRAAREQVVDARRLLREGIDPSAHRQALRQAPGQDGSFEAVAREWHTRWKTDKAESHWRPVLRALERDVFPRLGRHPIDRIEPVTILPVLRAVEARGAVDTAHRIRGYMGMVFRYGIATGRCPRDPSADLRGALAPVVPGHLGAVVEAEEFGALLRAIDGYQGLAVTAWALRLAPLVVLRPGELRGAEWDEIDLESATWTVPARRMKGRRDHVVPLSRQAVEILEEAQGLTGKGRLVFPSVRSRERVMSDNTLNAALRRLGFTSEEATAHGFRASFRTLGAEELGIRPELLEHQLAHEVRDPLGRAYNRTQFLAERREMMQRWADWCDYIKRPSAARPTGAARTLRSGS